VDLETKRFYQRGCFCIIGASGTGKTHSLAEALSETGKHFKFDKDIAETYLFLFAGASNVLRRDLEKKLDKMIFTKIFWPVERVGKCKELLDSLRESRGRRRHVVIVDDYIAADYKETELIKSLMTLEKRHEEMTLIFMFHQLRHDRRLSAGYLIIDNADRIYFTRGRRNALNVRTFCQRFGIPEEGRTTAVDLICEGEEWGLACFDRDPYLFIGDFRKIERHETAVALGKKCAALSHPLRSRLRRFRLHPARQEHASVLPRARKQAAEVRVRREERDVARRPCGLGRGARSLQGDQGLLQGQVLLSDAQKQRGQARRQRHPGAGQSQVQRHRTTQSTREPKSGPDQKRANFSGTLANPG